jgi:hypothetical protein
MLASTILTALSIAFTASLAAVGYEASKAGYMFLDLRFLLGLEIGPSLSINF